MRSIVTAFEHLVQSSSLGFDLVELDLVSDRIPQAPSVGAAPLRFDPRVLSGWLNFVIPWVIFAKGYRNHRLATRLRP